jgi:hypothetical protein
MVNPQLMTAESFRDFWPDQPGARVKKSIITLAALAAALGAARADLVMKQESGVTNVTDHVTVLVHDDKMRMEQRDQDGYTFSVIVDLNTRDSLTLFPRGKTFLKRSGAESRQMIETGIAASHGTNEMDSPPAPPRNTGNTAKVDGYDTGIYQWSGAGGLTETLWVATNFPGYSAIRTELAKIDRFNAAGAHRNAQPELAPLPGMVVKAEKTANGRKTIITLVSARTAPVPASLFELPADYSPWTPPVVLQTTNAMPVPDR